LLLPLAHHLVALSKLPSYLAMLSQELMSEQAFPTACENLAPRTMELRKTHPYGVAGALISIPELREPLYKQGQALLELVKEALAQLSDDQRPRRGRLIVSHSGAMVAMEKY